MTWWEVTGVSLVYAGGWLIFARLFAGHFGWREAVKRSPIRGPYPTSLLDFGWYLAGGVAV